MEEVIRRYKDEIWDNIWEESKKVYFWEKFILVGISVFYMFAMVEWDLYWKCKRNARDLFELKRVYPDIPNS